jgi:hypothetical protein
MVAVDEREGARDKGTQHFDVGRKLRYNLGHPLN